MATITSLQINMSSFSQGFLDDKDAKFNSSNSRMTTLNPHAAEFVPSVFRSTFVNTRNEHATRPEVLGASGKAVLDRSESNISNNSDDEVHQYWRRQLPDDITPDFKFMAQDVLQGEKHLSLASLSIHDSSETSRLSASAAQQDLSSLAGNNFSSSDRFGYSGLAYQESQPAGAFMTSAANSWDNQFINGDMYYVNEREGHQFNGEPSARFINDLLGDDSVTADAAINPVELLASQFPGFSSESLADVYYANGCDLNLTVEMLTQLELQVDGGFRQNLNPKASAAPTPNFNVMDFPALSATDDQNGFPKYTGDNVQQTSSTYRSPFNISRGAANFASTVKKLAPQEPGLMSYEKNGSGNGSLGVNRSSYEKLLSGEKLRNSGSTRAAPVWLETGEAVADMYSESREEARDFARLRNTCFEQATQAYLIGNKALAKELSLKGQLYSMKMKEAHGKARETIYRQRNPGATGQDRLIDLHGLHVNEAIHILKHELSTLRSTARSAGKRLQVMICVGTGHHTKGSRTPARLPVAVEQYLVDQGLHYTQPQPGLLRVVIY